MDERLPWRLQRAVGRRRLMAVSIRPIWVAGHRPMSAGIYHHQQHMRARRWYRRMTNVGTPADPTSICTPPTELTGIDDRWAARPSATGKMKARARGSERQPSAQIACSLRHICSRCRPVSTCVIMVVEFGLRSA